MANKKNFSQTAQDANPVYKTLTPPQTIEEAEQAQAAGKRINMLFTAENYDFIKLVATTKHITMTDLVNIIVAEKREAYGDKVAKAMEALKDLEALKDI